MLEELRSALESKGLEDQVFLKIEPRGLVTLFSAIETGNDYYRIVPIIEETFEPGGIDQKELKGTLEELALKIVGTQMDQEDL